MDVNYLLNFFYENDTRTYVLNVDEINDNMVRYSKDEVEFNDGTQYLGPVYMQGSTQSINDTKKLLVAIQKIK